MTKTFLLVLGALILLLGLWGLLVLWLPDMAFGLPVGPWWYSLVEVVLGASAVYVAYTDK